MYQFCIDIRRLKMIFAAHVCRCIPNRGSPPAILLREATARPARPRTERWQTCRIGPPNASSSSAPYCAASTAAGRRCGGDRPRAAARPRACRGHHGSAHRSRGSAAASRATTPTRSGCWSDHRTDARSGGQTGHRADARSRHRQSFVGRDVGAGRVTAKEVYATLDWLGSEQSFIETRWPDATSRTARCCSTTSPPLIWKDAAANSRGMATAATTVATGRSWSSACCAPPTAAPSRSRCSRAIPPIR